MSASCEGCVHSLFVDEGYSNWTVEGTIFHCVVKAHPEAPFDRWYGEDKRLGFARECGRFTPGEGDDLDVDREGWDDLSDAARAYLDEEGER